MPIFCNEYGKYNMEGDEDHLWKYKLDAKDRKFNALEHAYAHTLEQMSDLNAHMGYQFTQVVMSHKARFRELTK